MGDTAQMAQLAAAAQGKPGTEDVLLASQADTAGWYGKLNRARELTWRAMDSAEHDDAKEAAAKFQAAAALREVEVGNQKQALVDADAAMKLAPNRDVRAMAALALARAGDKAAAEKLAAELDQTFPLDTLVQRYWLPVIRAAVALEQKDPNRAVDDSEAGSTMAGEEEASGHSSVCLFARRGLSHAARRQRGASRISEVHRPPWTGGELSLGRVSPPRRGSSLRRAGERRSGPCRLPGLPRLSGKTPTPTFPSTFKPSPSTQSCNNFFALWTSQFRHLYSPRPQNLGVTDAIRTSKR